MDTPPFPHLSLLLLSTLLACGPEDADEDGYTTPLDCADEDPETHPGALERCNDRDDNCDGAVDEGAIDAPTWYADLDGDGSGAGPLSLVACTAPPGWAATDDDCDDADAGVHPGAAELCGNGVDDDCDGAPGACRLTGWHSADEADAVILGSLLSHTGLQLDLADLTGDGRAEILIGMPSIYVDADCASALLAFTWPLPGARVQALDAPLRWCHREENGLGTDHAVDDLDGDGRQDLVLSNPYETWTSSSEGLVMLWYGPAAVGTADWWSASTMLFGGSAANGFGSALATGDFDGDGSSDLVASMSTDDALAANGGSVHVFAGPLDRMTWDSRALAALAITGAEPDAYLGMCLQTVPDMDQDGGDELLVAAPHADTDAANAGIVRVFSGLLTGDDEVADADFTVRGTGIAEGLGWISAAGDLDGDGQGDVVIGSPWGGDGAGSALAWFGPLVGVQDALPGSADLSVLGPEAGGQLGHSVSLDDVDGDGQDDLLVGSNSAADGLSQDGHLLVFYGPLAPGSLSIEDADLVIAGVEPLGWFGYGEAHAADLDGDGVPELVVAAPMASLQGLNSESGAVYVFRGRGL